MKPTTKPTRTEQQHHEEEAIRRQHAANPIRQWPAGALSQQSFAAILDLVTRFKKAREEQGLTLAEVAGRMGIDAPALSRLETGKMLNPTLATLQKWAEALGQELEVGLSAEIAEYDVLAHFGAAALRASSLEMILTNVLLLCARLSGKASTVQDLDAMEDGFQTKKYTLGKFIDAAKAAVAIPTSSVKTMEQALRLRNYLIHNFFLDKAFEFATAAGRKRMIVELRTAETTIRAADTLMTDLADKLAGHLGITLSDINAEAERLRHEARKCEQSHQQASRS